MAETNPSANESSECNSGFGGVIREERDVETLLLDGGESVNQVW